MKRIARQVPLYEVVQRYTLADLRQDVQAGLTVAAMIVPQSIAYGVLAGVPPQVALYAALVPVLVYVLLGTCRELSVGPAALVSIMTAQAIHAVAPEAEAAGPSYTSLAVALALLVGALQAGMGFLRLGRLVNLLSRPVVNGFMSAAALLIAASQLPLVLGVALPQAGFVDALRTALAASGDAHLPTVLLSAACVLLLVATRRLAPAAPSALVLVVLATIASVGLDLPGRGIAVVGAVESGLPRPAIPDLVHWRALLPHAVAIALVGFTESISVAKTYGFKHRYDVDANRELLAVGLGNVAGGLFGALPATGNISRTVVSAQAGVRTQLAGGVTALAVVATLCWLAPLFAPLPKPALAAIVIVAVVGLIDSAEPVRLLRFKNADAAALVITFAATLLQGVGTGIASGVAVAVGLHLWRTSNPHVATLGRLPGTARFRDVHRHSDAQLDPDLVLLRINESLYFVNAPVLKDAIEHASNTRETVPAAIVLDFIAVNDVDSTALEVLEQVADELAEAGTRLVLAELSAPLQDIMEASGTLDRIGRDAVFDSVAEAVEAVEGFRGGARGSKPA